MTISSAIHDRHLLSFTYDGFPRVVEPHCYGTDKKGHPALRAYQVQGGSESGEYVGWRLFHIRKIRQLTILPGKFLARVLTTSGMTKTFCGSTRRSEISARNLHAFFGQHILLLKGVKRLASMPTSASMVVIQQQ